jgi:hypothetical protein
LDNWKNGLVGNIDDLKDKLRRDLDEEISQSEMKKLNKKSAAKLNQLGDSSKKDLLKVQSSNYLRNAKVVKFVKEQMKKFRSMGSKIMANQLKYVKARKKIWMENDQLNRMENQKVYEEELRAYMLQFYMIKKQLYKNFAKLEKKSRRYAQKVSEKILEAQIRKYAKFLNEEYKETLTPDYETYWTEEVEIMRQMDFNIDKDWKEDLKMANIAAAKFT